jgi:hypothetical protein
MSEIIDADPGQHLDDFAKELRLIARARRETVRGRHNGQVLTAYPMSTIHGIVSQWKYSDGQVVKE